MNIAELAPVGSRLVSEPDFQALLSWAKGVATALGDQELKLEHLALGAHLAHKTAACAPPAHWARTSLPTIGISKPTSG
jgi:hypothetical protein